jgi:hypothetical protein
VDIVVVVAVAVGADLQPEDCRPLALLEAVAEVMGMLVEVKEANHILEAPRPQILKIDPLWRDNNFLSPDIFQFFFSFSLSCS